MERTRDKELQLYVKRNLFSQLLSADLCNYLFCLQLFLRVLVEVSISVLEIEVANYYQINEELGSKLTFHVADWLLLNPRKENAVAEINKKKCNIAF